MAYRSEFEKIDIAIKRLTRLRGFYMSEQRKRDARLKIQLGALVVKAGLSEVDTGFLLGVLLDASSRLNDELYFHRLKQQGDQAFQKEPLSMEGVE